MTSTESQAATWFYGSLSQLNSRLSYWGFVLLLFAAPAHGDNQQTESAPDTTGSVDVTSQVIAFTEALDSVYASISGTYLGIEPILKRSCYDCHSDQTDFPWYHSIPGIRGMLDNDVLEARKRLDFSKGFPFGGRGSQEEQLDEMREEIEGGGMPLWTYRLMHWNTLIEGTAQDSVFRWIDSSLAAIQQAKTAYGIEDAEPER